MGGNIIAATDTTDKLHIYTQYAVKRVLREAYYLHLCKVERPTEHLAQSDR